MSVSAASAPAGDPFGDPRSRTVQARHRSVRGDVLYRRQVGHDIRHELSTIMLLASVLSRSDDVGPDSRARVAQIATETRWLEQLLSAYERDAEGELPEDRSRTRLDVAAREILQPIRLSDRVTITLEAVEVTARVDRLAFWRLLRNIICNAVEAAGEGGRVAVSVYPNDGHAVVEVDDDGPGFDPARARGSSLGLMIVADLIEQWHGQLAIGRGSLGGCGVRLRLPAVEPTDPPVRRTPPTLGGRR
jgi:signal transduction histidine kinase